MDLILWQGKALERLYFKGIRRGSATAYIQKKGDQANAWRLVVADKDNTSLRSSLPKEIELTQNIRQELAKRLSIPQNDLDQVPYSALRDLAEKDSPRTPPRRPQKRLEKRQAARTLPDR